MISRQEAREIALQAISRMECLSEGTGVAKVLSAEELERGRLSIYWASSVPFDRCWVAYIERPLVGMRSSLVVVISKDDGEIVYAGSANDEG